MNVLMPVVLPTQIGSQIGSWVSGGGPTYITDIDEWTAYLDTIGATAYTDEELIYTEMGYANYNSFLTAIDEGSTITRTAVLAAWTAVAP